MVMGVLPEIGIVIREPGKGITAITEITCTIT